MQRPFRYQVFSHPHLENFRLNLLFTAKCWPFSLTLFSTLSWLDLSFWLATHSLTSSQLSALSSRRGSMSSRISISPNFLWLLFLAVKLGFFVKIHNHCINYAHFKHTKKHLQPPFQCFSYQVLIGKKNSSHFLNTTHIFIIFDDQ